MLRSVARRPDIAALCLLGAFTAVAGWPLVVGGTAIGMDAVTQFYPWYSYLGRSLASGEIPAWNPHLLSGAPFAADPLSGWTYLPAMLFFTVLPLVAAAKVYLVFHLLLAGLSSYALSRSLGMGTAGALLAATAYEFSGYLYVRNTCCFAYASVVAWLPLAVLGAELAIRSRSWLQRGLWWGLCGLAVSQILAAWLGQGSAYALLALGGYVVYRTLLFPPENVLGLSGRLSALALHGGAVLLVGFALAAAGLLPRLEYNALSNLAGGYPNPEPGDGLPVQSWPRVFMVNGMVYAGVVTSALALAAPLMAGRRFAAPYFAVLCLAALELARPEQTWLHSLLYHLPAMEQIHSHAPERVLVVFYLGAAMLAGSTLTVLLQRGREAPHLAALPALAALFLATRPTQNDDLEAVELPFVEGFTMPSDQFYAVACAVALAAAAALLPGRAPRYIAAGLLVLITFNELVVSGLQTMDRHTETVGLGHLEKIDLSSYYEPTGATRFLRAAGEQPYRYAGYWPKFDDQFREVSYNYRFMQPGIRALEAENRAILRDGLQSVHGYNALHLARYEEYMDAANDFSQRYHNLDIYSDGLKSPLLDLLNVRYIVSLASETSQFVEDPDQVGPMVYEDDRVRIFENEDALPRAWIVHSARQMHPLFALDRLDSGTVDPRQTALLPDEPPPLGEPDDPSEDRARVTEYEANRIELQTATGARGLLVLSEVYYPGWNAYVDGKQVPLHRANHLLRAVPVPAGEHEVELRYEPWTLRAGIAISTVTAAAMLAVAAAALIQRRRAGKAGSE